jgi:phosphoglycolate phosphatase-like HAD superfamily hydrolase
VRFFQTEELTIALDDAVSEFRLHLRKNLGRYSRATPGSVQLLQYLGAKQIKSAVATTKPTDLAVEALRACGLSVDFIQGTDDFEPKPDPEVVIRCLTKFDVEGPGALMVGDRSADVLAGQSAGCMTIGVLSDKTSMSHFKEIRPNYVFDSLIEMHDWLRGFD